MKETPEGDQARSAAPRSNNGRRRAFQAGAPRRQRPLMALGSGQEEGFPQHPDNGHGLDPALLETIRQDVLSVPGPVTTERVAAAVNSTGRFLGPSVALAAVESINAELRGLGPLQVVADVPGVTDIFVNGPDGVWWDRGAGLERIAVPLGREEQVRALAQRLISAGGRRLDEGNPCVDVRLPGGYRVHAVIPPLSPDGTVLSIRIRRDRRFTLAELGEAGMFTPDILGVLQTLMNRRLNFLISGATGSGKTTLLSSLLSLAGAQERLVLIEDASELDPGHPHVIRLESRHGNIEGKGAIGLRELVRESLRMRPDRLVVGECRGSEVRELLMALNTGHCGAGTLHANSADDVPARLEALCALAGMDGTATAAQVSSAVDVVIHLDRTSTGREIRELSLVRARDGRLATESVLRHVGGRLSYGPGWPAFRARLSPGTEA